MQWMMAHPWMTFTLIALAILVLDNIITNVLNCCVLPKMRQKKEHRNDDIANLYVEVGNDD